MKLFGIDLALILADCTSLKLFKQGSCFRVLKNECRLYEFT